MQKGPVIFVALDTEFNVFGGFLSCDFKCSDEYYGSAESFLFKFDKENVNFLVKIFKGPEIFKLSRYI